jgi:hypothetical protein
LRLDALPSSGSGMLMAADALAKVALAGAV